jgi:S1-C subfamily serine protease
MFKDLPETHMFFNDIMRHVNLGLISGYEDGTVKPDEPLTLGRYCAIQSRKMFRDRVEKDVLDKVRPAVVMIVSKLPDGKTSVGTGFFISPTCIATNQHVVNGANEWEAYNNFGGVWKLKLKALTDISDRHDLAIMELGEGYIPYKHTLKLRQEPIYQGQHIGVLGSPLVMPNTFTQGVVSNTDREDDQGYASLFQTDAAVNPGNSGGPIIDGRGEVCGVVVSKVMAVGIDNIAFGIKAEHLRKFAEAMGVVLGV